MKKHRKNTCFSRFFIFEWYGKTSKMLCKHMLKFDEILTSIFDRFWPSKWSQNSSKMGPKSIKKSIMSTIIHQVALRCPKWPHKCPTWPKWGGPEAPRWVDLRAEAIKPDLAGERKATWTNSLRWSGMQSNLLQSFEIKISQEHCVKSLRHLIVWPNFW